MIQTLRTNEFNRRLARLPDAEKQLLTRIRRKEDDQLHIVYAMTHVGISGGVKVIFEHANRLKKAGARVSLVSHFQKPSWFPIETEYIQVPFDLDLAKGIPNCDVIVATYWDHIQACIETGIAPVVYFEQGDFHLFDYDSMNGTLKNFIQRQLEIPPFIFTVSNQASKQIVSIYGREAKVIPNAVDEDIFTMNGGKERGERPYLLMVGAESAKFKGIADIISAYEKVKSEFDIDLYWITPEQPSEAMKKRVAKVFVGPTQQKISSLYRGASLYICGSTYESFSLPALEAMACGCPVVTTNNIGVLEYAVDQENAVICQMKDPVDMAEKMACVLSSEEIQKRLTANGLITVEKYKWYTIIEELLFFYKKVASHKVKGQNRLSEWEIAVKAEHFLAKEDLAKLKNFLRVTSADIVKVPVVYAVEKAPAIARWEVVACRKHGDEGKTEHCFTPLLPFNKLQLFNFPGYRSFLVEEYENALAEFQFLYDREEIEKEKAAIGRWVILSLLRLQRKQQAKKRLKEYIKQFPDHADFYWLKSHLDENAKEKASSIETVKLLGDATSLPEFFYQVNRENSAEKPT
ncbi:MULTISPECIES: glycosyltransferase family 4 protein [unclassified Mesobacillus]|uniref:glycosyltransferase family 4 protein n=1 Tax=unclassified Mesobacillus TaxID=2675270 RepID=UPI00203A526E|nr:MULTISPECIES: glycosyltransferase family 4 protein [unclassified Mesobacillus]MCM3125205.1 glycosyltransferase family 4 protein [Mesobacillus sp. MER 33]MCM3235364.1 glycosyltransferase family 4 protein [Mesobacillus sp. MER 48]